MGDVDPGIMVHGRPSLMLGAGHHGPTPSTTPSVWGTTTLRPIRRPARYTISPLDLELQPANTDDRAGTLPMLPRLATLGFEGDLLGDSGFKGAPFAAAALLHDIHAAVSPGGTRDGRFLPSGIRWVAERLLDRKRVGLG